MDCREFRMVLPASMDGELTVDLEDHRRHCRDCAREFKALQDTLSQIDTWEPTVPHVDLWVKIQNEVQHHKVTAFPLRSKLVALSSCAAAALLVALGILFWRPGQKSPTETVQIHPVPVSSSNPATHTLLKSFIRNHMAHHHVQPPEEISATEWRSYISHSTRGYHLTLVKSWLCLTGEHFDPQGHLDSRVEKRVSKALADWKKQGVAQLKEAQAKAKFTILTPDEQPLVFKPTLKEASVQPDGKQVLLSYWIPLGQFSIIQTLDSPEKPIGYLTQIREGHEFLLFQRRVGRITVTILTSELPWSEVDAINEALK